MKTVIYKSSLGDTFPRQDVIEAELGILHFLPLHTQVLFSEICMNILKHVWFYYN